MSFPIYIILENIRSAFNVGAIFRTADTAGIEKLYLTGYTPCPPHSKIPKTALGATESVNWEHEKDTSTVIEKLYQLNITVIAAEITPRSKIYTQFTFPKPVAIVFGNEVTGISKKTLKLCTEVIAIPMFGKKESLNVEVSAGIIVYEIIRQYSRTPKLKTQLSKPSHKI